jgi:hypothetical protein
MPLLVVMTDIFIHIHNSPNQERIFLLKQGLDIMTSSDINSKKLGAVNIKL